jgi:hypothetical protein
VKIPQRVLLKVESNRAFFFSFVVENWGFLSKVSCFFYQEKKVSEFSNRKVKFPSRSSRAAAPGGIAAGGVGGAAGKDGPGVG